MTKTGPANVVMSACGHATPSRPVLARPGSRELVSVWPVSGEPTVVRAVFPGLAFSKPAPGWRLAPRYRRLRSALPMPRQQRVRARRPRSPMVAHPLYLYLLQWPAVALPGCPFDPGRGMLCILTLPPRWLQWP
jgi:hypothetical protein